MYSGCIVVRHGGYQLSLAKGLTESHSSAMHEYAALLPQIAVTALRPEGERGGEKEKERETKTEA